LVTQSDDSVVNDHGAIYQGIGKLPQSH